MKVVDPLNPIPKYLQISSWLKELIQAGRYKKGEKLPSEIKLSETCQVNRNTLRQAIGELVSAGILRKEKGTGTFVVSSTPIALKHKLKQITSFSDDLKELGIRERTKILTQGIETASSHIEKTLMLGEKNNVIAVRRLRTGDGIPLIYEESFLPCDMFKDILNLDLTGSMYKLISEHFKTVLARSTQTLSAVNLKKKNFTVFKPAGKFRRAFHAEHNL